MEEISGEDRLQLNNNTTPIKKRKDQSFNCTLKNKVLKFPKTKTYY